MHWLIHQETLRQMLEQRRAVSISAEEQIAHEERVAAREGADPRSLSIAGDVAEIRVEGLLTKKEDFWSWLFGSSNTTYADLMKAISMVRSDQSVRSVRVFVDSPGGSADGFFEVLDAFKNLRAEKKVDVVAANAYSAAYGIAAVAGKITAVNAGSMFGSVGVATSYAFWEGREQIDITNTDSPNKRPDVRTPEGRAVIVSELDSIFALFAERIAEGRNASADKGLTTDDVAEQFGRGASYVAGDAKRRGMIDAIAKPTLRVVNPTALSVENEPNDASAESGGGRKQVMTLEELRSQHPNVFAAAVLEGVNKGTTDERDRVLAHLKMGETSGDMKTATEAIRSGAGMSLELQATYLAAGMNRADRSKRQQDSDAAGAVVDGAPAVGSPNVHTPTSEADVYEAQVVALLEQRRGKTKKAG